METLTHVRLLQRKQILKEWRQEVNENSLFESTRHQLQQLMKTILQDTLEQDLELQRERASVCGVSEHWTRRGEK